MTLSIGMRPAGSSIMVIATSNAQARPPDEPRFYGESTPRPRASKSGARKETDGQGPARGGGMDPADREPGAEDDEAAQGDGADGPCQRVAPARGQGQVAHCAVEAGQDQDADPYGQGSPVHQGTAAAGGRGRQRAMSRPEPFCSDVLIDHGGVSP